MKQSKKIPALSESLEDYLETIHTLIRDRKVARVKEIAEARSVRMASVSTAMHRLSEMGLVKYNQREFIELTPEGEECARRTMARHDLLVRFFREILQVSPDQAEEDACSVEHSLSDELVDRMVRFFEYLTRCPRGTKGKTEFIESFHKCSVVNPELSPCENECDLCVSLKRSNRSRKGRKGRKMRGACRLSDLNPGQTGTILQVQAKGAVRQRLIDMGMLPDTKIEVERKAAGGNPIWIKMKGFQLSLRREEAAGVTVSV